jgi:hypothetical protein
VRSSEGLVRPAALLAFRIGRDKAAEDFRKWLSGLWLAPNALRSESSLTALQGVYVPFFTFDAMAYATWTAESAELIPYEPECLAGFLAEENAIGLAEAWENAQEHY